jgi:hypothetical protein
MTNLLPIVVQQVCVFEGFGENGVAFLCWEGFRFFSLSAGCEERFHLVGSLVSYGVFRSESIAFCHSER